MQVLNPTYMAPNMTALARMTILSIHLHCLTKRDGHDMIFPFAKETLNGHSRYESKRINPHIYQPPESNCFIAVRAIGAHEALLNV